MATTKGPLFRDPIYDGATDPVVIWCEEEECFYLFYTQRRTDGVTIGVSSIHGSSIGVASSKDGGKWLYRGTLDLEFEHGHNTFWAPEIIYGQGCYHMYVSYITGIPTDWNYERKIIHYTANNMWDWKLVGEIPLSSNRVIDACVYEIAPNQYKMWYKDEVNNCHTYSAISNDLYHWEVVGAEITDCAHEGPNVFEFSGKKWMITDCWDGLAVYESDDFSHWKRVGDNLLKEPGKRQWDRQKGNHADVVVIGEEAHLFYFCHTMIDTKIWIDGEEEIWTQARAAIWATKLTFNGTSLACNRNEEWEKLI